MAWARANLGWLLPLLGLLGAMGAAYVAYAADKRVDPVETRVTRLETHREHDAKEIEKANQKLDFLIERLVR